MACVKKHGLQRGINSVFVSSICRSSSKASCCSRTRVDYCHSHGLRLSAEHFQCSNAVIGLGLGSRVWGLRLKVGDLGSRV